MTELSRQELVHPFDHDTAADERGQFRVGLHGRRPLVSGKGINGLDLASGPIVGVDA